MDQFTALVTGASGGIGGALCHEFAIRGYNLIISGRNRQRLNLLALQLRRSYRVDVTVVVADLGLEGGVEHLLRSVADLGVRIDVLVNNAGFGRAGQFARNDPAVQRAMMRVNMHAPTELCRALLPEMLARGSGRILNVASTGAFVAGPHNAIYCASKAYLLSLSEALSQEVRGSGVCVTAVCPGATQTGFAKYADMETTPLFRFGVMDAQRVARVAYRALMQGKPTVVVGGTNKLVVAACKLAPRVWSAVVSGFIQRPRVVPTQHGRAEMDVQRGE